MIERSLNATEKAIESIREGDLVRRHTVLELRDMQISMSEDFDQIRGMMHELDHQIDKERAENSKWMNRKMEKAKATADQAVSEKTHVYPGSGLPWCHRNEQVVLTASPNPACIVRRGPPNVSAAGKQLPFRTKLRNP